MAFVLPTGWVPLKVGLWMHRAGFLVRGITHIGEADQFSSIGVYTDANRFHVLLGRDYQSVRRPGQNLIDLARRACRRRIGYMSWGQSPPQSWDQNGFPVQFSAQYLKVSDQRTSAAAGVTWNDAGAKTWWARKGTGILADNLGGENPLFVFAIPHAVASGYGVFNEKQDGTTPTAGGTLATPPVIGTDFYGAMNAFTQGNLTCIVELPLNCTRGQFLDGLISNSENSDRSEVRNKCTEAANRVAAFIGGMDKQMTMAVPITIGDFGNGIVAPRRAWYRWQAYENMGASRIANRMVDYFGASGLANDGQWVTIPGPPVQGGRTDNNWASFDVFDNTTLAVSSYALTMPAGASAAPYIKSVGGVNVHNHPLYPIGATLGGVDMVRLAGPVFYGQLYDQVGQQKTNAGPTFDYVVAQYANVIGTAPKADAAVVSTTKTVGGIPVPYTNTELEMNVTAAQATARATRLTTFLPSAWDQNTVSPGMMTNLYGMSMDYELDPTLVQIAAPGLDALKSLSLI